MTKLDNLIKYIENLISPKNFKDSSLNGLQIEGKKNIKKIAASVDSGISVINEAVEKNIDFLLVHHGIFWGMPLAISGSHKILIKKILDASLNLYAQHLPIDAHSEFGNNALLAKKLGLELERKAINYGGQEIAYICKNPKKLSFQSICKELELLVGADKNFKRLAFGTDVPESILIITGSGADAIYEFSELNFDTIITGEPKQFTYHFAKDNNLNAAFAGHYATETLGVDELGKHLAEKFKLEYTFINQPTGI